MMSYERLAISSSASLIWIRLVFKLSGALKFGLILDIYMFGMIETF